jgi:hypothetical protein
MGDETSADLDSVRYAFRLGWAVAELRGRDQPSRYDQRDPGISKVFKRGAFQLPLSRERSPAEIRKELLQTVEDLMHALELDANAKVAHSWGDLKPVLKKMKKADDEAGREALWGEASKCFFHWDACLQDALVLEATWAAGYQLGRGLAETYWALEPDRTAEEMGSWEFIFGQRRQEVLQRLAARLSSFLGAPVVAAVEGPLAAWGELAGDPTRRSQPDVAADLYRQGLLWRDLIRGERHAGDLSLSADVDAPPTAKVWKELHLYRDALLSLKLPVLGGLVGIAALVVGATLLASGAGHSGLNTAISLLGAIGVTSAGLSARAKANATSLLDSLQTRFEVDRVRQAADLCPTSKSSRGPVRITHP